MARILLADDDAATRDLMCRALEMEGHAVTITQEGAEALSAITTGLTKRGGSFDLLITDVQMPVMDGISLVQQVLAAAPALRIILISGHLDQLQRAAGLADGNLRTLMKPFTLDAIRAKVAATLAD